jgi:hypothetical protein
LVGHDAVAGPAPRCAGPTGAATRGRPAAARIGIAEKLSCAKCRSERRRPMVRPASPQSSPPSVSTMAPSGAPGGATAEPATPGHGGAPLSAAGLRGLSSRSVDALITLSVIRAGIDVDRFLQHHVISRLPPPA